MANTMFQEDDSYKEALEAGDCKKVNDLLNNYPRLIDVVWRDGEEKSAHENSAEERKSTRSTTRGRTALHVAARRGDVELVRKCLELTEQLPKDSRDSFLKRKDEGYELDALAMAVINGSKEIVKLLGPVWPRSKSSRVNLCDASKAGANGGAEVQNKVPFNLSGASEIADHDATVPTKIIEITKKVLQEFVVREDEIHTLADTEQLEGDFTKGDEEQGGRIGCCGRFSGGEGRRIWFTRGGSGYDQRKGAGRDEVRPITEDVEDFGRLVPEAKYQAFIHRFRQEIEYDEDFDFNFLDFHQYLFHFSFSIRFVKNLKVSMRWIRETIFSHARKDKKVLRYLLFELRDGQGRTPLHVAVDSPRKNMVKKFLHIIPAEGEEKDLDAEFLNVRDSAGRTPLYRAAGKENSSAFLHLVKDTRTEVSALVTYCSNQWGEGLDVNELSSNNGFQSESLWDTSSDGPRNKILSGQDPSSNMTSSTAMHLAIIHKRNEHLRSLFDSDHKKTEFSKEWKCHRRFTWPVPVGSKDIEAYLDRDSKQKNVKARKWGKASHDYVPPPVLACLDRDYMSSMELAVLVGGPAIVQTLLKYASPKNNEDLDKYLPTFLLAAAVGNPTMIKVFMDSKKGRFNWFNPRIRDHFANTALHYAFKKSPVFHPHLLDFVTCRDVLDWRRKNSQDRRGVSKDGELGKSSASKKEYGPKKGCIVALLHAGIDIWEENTEKRTAGPEHDAPDEFLTWWYDKVVQETEKVQKKLNDAANGITVTAALVATASYVGPLQPPLGYTSGDVVSARVNIQAIRVFVVCDTLSFYLALAAIMLALLPALPQPQNSIFTELGRTRTLVALSVTFLFPSIICVLVAFAASSIAVVPHDNSSYSLSASTAAIGALICSLVIIWFTWGLFKVLQTLPAVEFIVKHYRKYRRQQFLPNWVRRRL